MNLSCLNSESTWKIKYKYNIQLPYKNLSTNNFDGKISFYQAYEDASIYYSTVIENTIRFHYSYLNQSGSFMNKLKTI